MAITVAISLQAIPCHFSRVNSFISSNLFSLEESSTVVRIILIGLVLLFLEETLT